MRLPDTEAPLCVNARQNPPLSFLCVLGDAYVVLPRTLADADARSSLSIAKFGIASSRARPSIWSFVRMDQTCLGRGGGFAPVTSPLFQGTRFDACCAPLTIAE